MELGVRDWMLIVGVLLFVAVVLDGLRRMRAEQRETLRLAAKTRDTAKEEEPDERNPELPGGGARLVERRERPVRRKTLDNLEPIQPKDVLKPVKDKARQPARPAEGPAPQTGGSKAPAAEAEVAAPAEAPAQVATPDPAPTPTPEPLVARREDRVVETPVATPKREAPKREAPPPEPRENTDKPSDIQELIVLNVIADEADEYPGAELLEILLACDCRLGKMNIFHRYESPDGKGEPQFSIVNIVEPGTFDLDSMGAFTTPGVGFFMNMPGPDEPMKAFEAMLETARCVVKHLGGEIRDEMHSVATNQTFEHYRQRIRDFERKQLTLV